MEERELKEVMEKIHIKQEMEKEILMNVKDVKQAQKGDYMGRTKGNGWQRKAVVAALALMAVGAGGLTVRAVVNNQVKERMESLPEQEITEVVDVIDNGHVAAASYSREFTDAELKRMKELTIEYNRDGRFPEGEINIVEDESQVDSGKLCYGEKTGCYYLPDRELTDEEFLQMIDFSEKVDYALEKRYEKDYPKEDAKRKSEKERLQQKVEEINGISEEEAISIAGDWLNKTYGKTPTDYKVSCYLHQSYMEGDDILYYSVKYTIKRFENYNLLINAQDGDLLSIDGGIEHFEHMPLLSEAEPKVQALYGDAEKYLENIFGITEEYAEIYCRIVPANDKVSSGLQYWFVKEDGTAYIVSLCPIDSAFLSFALDIQDENYDYEKMLKRYGYDGSKEVYSLTKLK